MNNKDYLKMIRELSNEKLVDKMAERLDELGINDRVAIIEVEASLRITTAVRAFESSSSWLGKCMVWLTVTIAVLTAVMVILMIREIFA